MPTPIPPPAACRIPAPNVIRVVLHRFQVAGLLARELFLEALRRSSGSFSSEKPFAISRPPTKNSKRSVMNGSASLRRASGETSAGYAYTNVGCSRRCSRSPRTCRTAACRRRRPAGRRCRDDRNSRAGIRHRAASRARCRIEVHQQVLDRHAAERLREVVHLTWYSTRREPTTASHSPWHMRSTRLMKSLKSAWAGTAPAS